MRITQIDLKNFRAFYGEYSINLDNSGKNLLVYGENGSGKSSLYFALKYFLDAYQQGRNFRDYRNIFVQDADDAYLKLSLKPNQRGRLETYEWSETQNNTNDTFILNTAKSSGFLDYKRLLETYFLKVEKGQVNLFELLVENLLTHSEMTDGKTVGEAWRALLEGVPQRNTARLVDDYEKLVADFNAQLAFVLAELKKKVSEILGVFGFRLGLEFSQPALVYERAEKHLRGREIFLKTTFYDKDIGSHHNFLNEAKLTAIALSIYLASLLVSPKQDLKILVLDDVLIGLDMSNRIPVIKILKEYFGDYQIFFFTYDRAWFEMMRFRTSPSDWKTFELFSGSTGDIEMPVFAKHSANLEAAERHLHNHDLKAAVVYIRTALEIVLKKFCDGKVLVRYQSSPTSYNMEHFWQGIKQSGKVPEATLQDAKTYLKFMLNPLSHDHQFNPSRREVENAIRAVEKLDGELNGM